MPADWFGRALELLEAYCRHVSQADFLAVRINAFELEWLADPEGLQRYDRLLGMAVRESAVMLSLATKMRLTPQSRWSAKTASTATGRAGATRKP